MPSKQVKQNPPKRHPNLTYEFVENPDNSPIFEDQVYFGMKHHGLSREEVEAAIEGKEFQPPPTSSK